MRAYLTYRRSLEEAGVHVASAPLQPVARATTVRVRRGETLTTDGPFAETKEQLGGYYLVEANDVDEAIALADRVLVLADGQIAHSAQITLERPRDRDHPDLVALRIRLLTELGVATKDVS